MGAFLRDLERHGATERGRRWLYVPYDQLSDELGPLRAMEPAERELRADLAPLVAGGLLEILPHEGWLTTTAQFAASQPDGPPYRMDAFHRRVRCDTGILMERGKPAGGKYSFDAENRRPWRGDPPAPRPPRLVPDDVTREVLALVETRFGHHPGRPEPDGTHVTRCRYAELYKELGLPEFGYLFHCNRDSAMIEGFNPKITLTRTQTIMEGATHCDFRFRSEA